MVTYHFYCFSFETVLGREHSGKLSKKFMGNFYFRGITLNLNLEGHWSELRVPSLEGLEKFSHRESPRKISNLTELFYSHVLNTKRGSPHPKRYFAVNYRSCDQLLQRERTSKKNALFVYTRGLNLFTFF